MSPWTLDFYQKELRPFVRAFPDVKQAGAEGIRQYIDSLPCSPGAKHCRFRAIRAFFNWLEGEELLNTNPMRRVKGPRVPRKLLPALKPAQIEVLLAQAENVRDRAVLSLFADSGLRLRELERVKLEDIDWESNLARVWVKGGKEALAPFGQRTKELLREHLATYHPNGNIWGLNDQGIKTMLRRLEKKTGLKCNAHVFRRSFASALAQQGVDALHIMRLGRWETLAMVERYTRSVRFEDSLRFYKSPLSQG